MGKVVNGMYLDYWGHLYSSGKLDGCLGFFKSYSNCMACLLTICFVARTNGLWPVVNQVVYAHICVY